jgi:formylglycine-generating enzyme required for sulfatase activity
MRWFCFPALLVMFICPTVKAQCVGDLYFDGRVDGVDLGALLAYWGPVTGSDASRAADLTLDGAVDGNDLGALLARWGLCPAVITGLEPPHGSMAGGTIVTITGRYLTGTTGVRFGASPASNFEVLNDSVIRATTPPGSPGPVDVAVTGPRGETVAPSAFLFLSVVTPSWATLIEPYPDPTVVPDPEVRSAISATGLAWRVRHSSSQIEMLLVPPGAFQMGCSPSHAFGCGGDEYPVHPVTISSAFYLGRFEVTQEQWQQITGSNPSAFCCAPDSPIRPVDGISWLSLQGFLSATNLRLPTEAEWEYACRAGTDTAFSNGSAQDDSLVDIAWFSVNSGGRTHPVGSKAANRFGFHDMLGNVWEWVADWAAPYSPEAQVDPAGPPGGFNKIFRGGSWLHSSYYSRVSSRENDTPGYAHDYKGFRVARHP